MRRPSGVVATFICVLMMMFFVMPLSAKAGYIMNNTLTAEENSWWSYDEETKTLTLTGETNEMMGNVDEGSVFNNICPDVEKVIIKDFKTNNCYYMFARLDKLQSVTFDNFDTSEVWITGSMFEDCTSLTELDLSSFDTSNLSVTSNMFLECRNLLYVDMSSFDMSKAETTFGMFDGCDSLLEIKTPKILANTCSIELPGTFLDSNKTEVKTLTSEFAGKILSAKDRGVLGNNKGFFWNYDEETKTLTVTGEDVGTFESLEGEVYYSIFNTISEDIETVIMKDCTIYDGKHLFAQMKNLKNVVFNNFNTSNITRMDGMFEGCTSLKSLDADLNTSKVENMMFMFAGCSNLESVDVSSFDTSKVIQMNYMFYNCSNLKSLDLWKFDFANTYDKQAMFLGCTKLEELDLSGVDLTKTQYDVHGLVQECTGLKKIHTPKYMSWYQDIALPSVFQDAEGNYTIEITAEWCGKTLTKAPDSVKGGVLGENDGITWIYDEDTKTLTITGEDSGLQGDYDYTIYTFKSQFLEICEDAEVIIVQDCTLIGDTYFMFADMKSLKRVEFHNVDTINVTDMSCMFSDCSNLSSLDVSELDTSNVTNMSGMFEYCSSLESLDVSKLDTSNVTNMSGMFNGCSSLENLDVSNFATGNVTNMSSMFRDCESLGNLDVSKFDTSKVTDMCWMFSDCSSLNSLNLSKFNTGKVTNMAFMFSGCRSLESLDVSSFNTSNVINMNSMFYYCSSLESLDVTNFITEKVTNITSMFQNCRSLKSLDLSSFDMTQVSVVRYFLDSCINLAIIETPKVVPETMTISLPDTFVDPKNEHTMTIITEFCNTTLINVDYLVSGITLNASSLSMHVGESGQLNAAVIPEKAILQTVTWKSSDTAVATVDTNGKVTAVGVGTATITATAKDGSGVSASCEVTVTQPVTGISLNKTSLSLETGGSVALTATVSPANATNKAVTWKSSDTAVATVDANGKVTAVSAGTATITVTAKDGNGVSASCTVTVTELMSEQERQVRAFVERMYTVALGRAAEEEGLDFYTQRLIAGDSNGACLAESFLCSPEFLNKGHDDAEYVKVLYKTFFDREPAADEVSYWVDKLASGQTRSFVLSGFVNSVEFDNLCSEYGISRGFMLEDGKPLNPGIGRFAERLYTVVLERAGEKEGIEYWSLNIANGTCTPKDAAKSFFLSSEYLNKNTSDAKYITTLYKTFMDREPEEGGVEYWQNVLNNGATREQILEGFADSAEFKGIMASFGL